MSLKNLITDLVSSSFDILDDLPESVVIIEQTNTYNYDTSRNEVVEVRHEIPKAILAQFTQKEMEKDEQINGMTDQKLIFPMKGVSFNINVNDVVEDANGIRWDVVKPKGVPGDSVGIYMIRRR